MTTIHQVKKSRKFFCTLAVAVGLSFTVQANNLAITSVNATGNAISFSISWNNSWYANTVPNNWDAVWVYVKSKDCNSTNWQHVNLETGNTHTITGGVLQVDSVTDGKGVFIRRISTGSGNITAATATLNMTGLGAGPYNFKVFGIEMVYVNRENFQVGDGTSSSTFSSISIDSTSQVNGVTAASLGGGASTVNVPSTYPMGYNAFYCMKYEITQEQYIDFLNTLSYTQQATHTTIAPNSSATNWAMNGKDRNAIKIDTSGVASTTPAKYSCDGNANNTYNQTSDGQNVAMNYLSWADLIAYLDWSGLRPMSEMEFEKICRGTLSRVGGEYPWGSSTALTMATSGGGTATYYGQGTEVYYQTGQGLCAYGVGYCGNNTATNIGGPMRVGFAATGTTNRVTGGSTYYGVLDMGGNVSERVVNVNSTGVLFTGSLGDGNIDSTGYATNTDWPNSSTATGSGSRGGNWYQGNTYLRISDRSAATTADAIRQCYYGGRGVRQQ